MGYIGILYHKEQPPEVWHIRPRTPCMYLIFIYTFILITYIYIYIYILHIYYIHRDQNLGSSYTRTPMHTCCVKGFCLVSLSTYIFIFLCIYIFLKCIQIYIHTYIQTIPWNQCIKRHIQVQVSIHAASIEYVHYGFLHTLILQIYITGVYTYIFIHVYIFIGIYIYIYIYIFGLYMYIHIFLHRYVYLYSYIFYIHIFFSYIYIQMYIPTFTWRSMYACCLMGVQLGCLHTHIYTHIYTYMFYIYTNIYNMFIQIYIYPGISLHKDTYAYMLSKWSLSYDMGFNPSTQLYKVA
jgi:hypothetical protein